MLINVFEKQDRPADATVKEKTLAYRVEDVLPDHELHKYSEASLLYRSNTLS